MGWFEERKAKKAAAKQAAAQAAQAAKDEKRRQEELQEQQTVSYVIGCITELENMKGAETGRHTKISQGGRRSS